MKLKKLKELPKFQNISKISINFKKFGELQKKENYIRNIKLQSKFVNFNKLQKISKITNFKIYRKLQKKMENFKKSQNQKIFRKF